MNIIFLIFLFIILVIILFLIINVFNYTEYNKQKIELFNNSNNNSNITCIYAYYEKNDIYKNNFKYFLDNGILDNVDYYIVINGDCSIDIPIRKNIIIYKRENKGYDFGAYSHALSKITKNYEYYFFINTSVEGPYLRNNTKQWIDYFIELFINNDTKVVGTSINIYENSNFDKYNLSEIYNKNKPFTHIQSMMFCIKYDYLNYLKSIDFFNEDKLNNTDNIAYIIAHKEIGLSQYAIINGWNINCILDKYKNLDYRKITNDINQHSKNGDPYFINAYFGETINKYDVIFYKSYRL